MDMVSKWFELMGTVHVMTVGLAMVGLLFFCMSFDFGVQSSNVLVVFLTIGQFSLGASMSAITTGYYSLTSVLFVNVEAAMSYIESSVGLGKLHDVSMQGSFCLSRCKPTDEPYG